MPFNTDPRAPSSENRIHARVYITKTEKELGTAPPQMFVRDQLRDQLAALLAQPGSMMKDESEFGTEYSVDLYVLNSHQLARLIDKEVSRLMGRPTC